MSENRSGLPNHWIGVRAAWPLLSDNPVDHLISIEPHHLATHTLIIGATGSGKTNLLHHLIAQDIARGQSVCVLDLRGDLVNTVIKLVAGRIDSKRLVLIDLRMDAVTCGFNPLYGNGEPYFRALNVLDVVATESESFGVQLAESLRMALLLLAELQQPLTNLERLFYDREYRQRSLASAKVEPVIGFWQRYDELSPDRQAAMAMPVLNKVSLLLATSTLRHVLGDPEPIDLNQQLTSAGSLTLVSLAVDELHAAGKMMGSLVLSAICREVFAQVNTAEIRRNPVRLYVDEFEHFGMKEFETILAEGRRFRLSVVLAHQTLAQLTPRMRSMILNNVGLKFCFRTGREDGVTLSKDIFGDPRAYDLFDLPVGYALMWQRELGTIEVEVNEPLRHVVGGLSPETREWLQQLPQRSSPSLPPRVVSQIVAPAPQARSVPKKNSTATLEEWLCD